MSRAPNPIRWVTAFLDTPVATAEQSEIFWLAVTGSTLSSRRGEDGEFATLCPDSGDAFLRVQRVNDQCLGVHLDLHVADPAALVEVAVGLGARARATPEDHTVLSSPSGITFCVVPHAGESKRPPPLSFEGRRSAVDHVCLAAHEMMYEAEVVFWEGLTGWARQSGAGPEFAYLDRPADLPLRLLIQRRDSDDSAPRVRLDLACADVQAEAGRHRQLGARTQWATSWWASMVDPVGRAYSLTCRDPDTGLFAV